MKNRRFALIAFLLCASILVGVGYAATITKLTVDGTASYTNSASNAYAEEIHFTGNVGVVNYNHDPLPDQTAVIAAAQAGDQRAIFSASFAADNIAVFEHEGQYIVGAVYEVQVKLPDGASAMTVTFGDLEVSGSVDQPDVDTGKPFIVEGHIRDSEGEAADLTTVTVDSSDETAEIGDTVTLYYHVKLYMSEDATSADIEDTAFEVLLPITGVEITP